MDNNIDVNKDNKISEAELQMYRRKLLAQRNMATACLVSSMLLTLIVLSPIVSDERLSIIIDLVVMYYIMSGSVIGAFMGFSSWMSKHK
jgi:hypothetical protein